MDSKEIMMEKQVIEKRTEGKERSVTPGYDQGILTLALGGEVNRASGAGMKSTPQVGKRKNNVKK